MKEYVAIVGSRDWKDPYAIYEVIRKLKPGTVVVTGGAPGVDTIAENEALAVGLVVIRAIPPWEILGKSAGPIRNKIIADIADKALIFWDGVSPGTENVISAFRRLNKPYAVISPQKDKK